MRTRFLELPGFQPNALFFATRMALSMLLAYYVASHPAPQPRRPVDALLLERAEELLASHEHALAASPGALGLASVDPMFTWVAAGAAHPGSHPYRPGAGHDPPGTGHDGHGHGWQGRRAGLAAWAAVAGVHPGSVMRAA